MQVLLNGPGSILVAGEEYQAESFSSSIGGMCKGISGKTCAFATVSEDDGQGCIRVPCTERTVRKFNLGKFGPKGCIWLKVQS